MISHYTTARACRECHMRSLAGLTAHHILKSIDIRHTHTDHSTPTSLNTHGPVTLGSSSTPNGGNNTSSPAETAPFQYLSYVLSRACLGKTFSFCLKWRKNDVCAPPPLPPLASYFIGFSQPSSDTVTCAVGFGMRSAKRFPVGQPIANA